MLISKLLNYSTFRYISSVKSIPKETKSGHFENVFTFPLITKFAIMNRLKVYQFVATSIAVPSCGLMEFLNMVPEHTFLSTLYIGLTGGAVLSLFTYPFSNVIGHLYISEDNKLIKISSVDFYGKRKDKIISADDWIPIYDLKPSIFDGFFLRPELTDGSKYKLFVKYGTIKNPKKMAEVLE